MKPLLTYALPTLLCAALLFSCAPEIEPLQLNEQNSSSDTEQPTWSQPNRSSSSSQQQPISSPTTQSSSSAQPTTSSSTVQSSSSAPPPTSSPTVQSSSSAPPPTSSPTVQSSSSLEQTSSEPRLVGTCKWDRTASETTTARGAIPSGVTLSDPNNICRGAKVVYKYDDGEKTWPSNGFLSEWKNWDIKHKETYSDVQATIDCPDYEDDIEPKDCPDLIVSTGAEHIIECTCPGTGQCQIDDRVCKVDGRAGKDVTLKIDECVEINVIGYNNQYDLPNVIMRCKTEGTQQNASVTISLNGRGKTYTGSYTVDPLVELGKIKLGDNYFGTLCITALSGATSIKCTGPGQ